MRKLAVDHENKTISATIESALFRPEKSRKDLRELLEAEVGLATEAIFQLREIDRVTLTLVNGATRLAIGEARRGQDRITMRFVDERLR